MAATDIITLFEAKRYLSMDQSDTTKDGELSTYITGISKALDSFSGPVVKRTIADELHDGGAPFIMLREYPVDSVVTVTDYRDTTATVLTAATLGATSLLDEYMFNPNNGLLYRRRNGYDWEFSLGRANVKVTYVAGRYANTVSVAEEFKLAACLSLAEAWKSSFGGGNVQYGEYAADERRVTYAIPYQAQSYVPRRAPIIV